MAAAHIVDAFFLERDFKMTLGADKPLFLSSSGQSGKRCYDLYLPLPAVAYDVLLLLLISVFMWFI